MGEAPLKEGNASRRAAQRSIFSNFLFCCNLTQNGDHTLIPISLCGLRETAGLENTDSQPQGRRDIS